MSVSNCASYHVYVDNYFTAFHHLDHLGDHNIQAIGDLNKKKLSKGDIMAEKELQKKGRGHITHPQIQVQLMSLVWWNDNMTVYVASIIVSNHNLQDLCAGGTKRKESTFKFSNQTNSIAITKI